MLKRIKRKESGDTTWPYAMGIIGIAVIIMCYVNYLIEYYLLPDLFPDLFSRENILFLPKEFKTLLFSTVVAALILLVVLKLIFFIVYRLDDRFQFLPSTKAENAYVQKRTERNTYVKKVKDENFAKIVCPYCANSSGDKFKTGTSLVTGNMFFVCRECGRSFFTEEQEALMEEQE